MGAYIALGAVWVVLRPGIGGILQQLGSAWNFLDAAAGLALLGVVLAALTVALDHGLTDRLREETDFGETALKRRRSHWTKFAPLVLAC